MADPRHGKRSLPSRDEQEINEADQDHQSFSFYSSSSRADQDLSAMVSALSHVIGTSPQRGGGEQGRRDTAIAVSSSNTMENEPQEEHGILYL